MERPSFWNTFLVLCQGHIRVRVPPYATKYPIVQALPWLLSIGCSANNKHLYIIYWVQKERIFSSYPHGMYLFKVSDRNTRARYEMYSNLRKRTPEQRQFLLNLSRFYTLFLCFSCWLWTRKCRLGINFFKKIYESKKFTQGFPYTANCSIFYFIFLESNNKPFLLVVGTKVICITKNCSMGSALYKFDKTVHISAYVLAL